MSKIYEALQKAQKEREAQGDTEALASKNLVQEAALQSGSQAEPEKEASDVETQPSLPPHPNWAKLYAKTESKRSQKAAINSIRWPLSTPNNTTNTAQQTSVEADVVSADTNPVPIAGRPHARQLAREVASLYRPILRNLPEGRGTVAFVGVDDDTTTALVAREFAQYLAENAGHQTLLVDGQEARGKGTGQLGYFEITPSTDLATVALHDTEVASALHSLGNSGLSVATLKRDTTSPDVAPGSPRYAQMMAELKRTQDLIVIDCPAISGNERGVALAADADVTILIIVGDHTSTAQARRLKNMIETAGGRPFGVVLSRLGKPGRTS